MFCSKLSKNVLNFHVKEDKMKERKRNNVIIHRMAESQETDDKEKSMKDRKWVMYLTNEVLKESCEDKDIKRVFRLGNCRSEKSNGLYS